jgi:hypothetical protein
MPCIDLSFQTGSMAQKRTPRTLSDVRRCRLEIGND